MLCLATAALLAQAWSWHGVGVTPPQAALANAPTTLSLSLPPASPSGARWPANASFSIRAWSGGAQLGNGTLSLYVSGDAALDGLALRDTLHMPLTAPDAGWSRLEVSLLDSASGVELWSNRGSISPLELWCIWPALSVLPPAICVALALYLRQVSVALALGVWVGGTITHGLNPLTGALRTVDTYLAEAVGGGSHPVIVVFTLLLGGMIAVVRFSGGAAGLANVATRCAKRPGQVLTVTAALGVAVGFDDYASILITGSAMQPVALSLGVHPLLLCWVLHGIGVCTASVHPLSSWFGVQLGYVAQQVALLPGLAEEASPLILLLSSTPYRLFPLLYLAQIGLMLGLPWAKHYGSMAKVTREGAETTPSAPQQPDCCDGQTDPGVLSSVAQVPATATATATAARPEQIPTTPTSPPPPPPAPTPGDEPAKESDSPPRASFAVVPFVAMLVGTPVGMYCDGLRRVETAQPTILDTFAAADSTAALTWATLLANLLAVGMPLALRCGGGRARGRARDASRLTLAALMDAWTEGVKEVMEALIILFFAWALGAVVSELQAAQFLSTAIGSWLPYSLLPAASMLIAMVVSFGVGSAWGTMGILIPLVAPLSWELSHRELDALTASIGAVMGGAVFGNIASPLADTSVLSAMIARCPMLEHVSSQATYAALTAAVALLLGAVPVGLGAYPIWAALAVGLLLLAAAPLVGRRGWPQTGFSWCRRRRVVVGAAVARPWAALAE